MKKKMVRTGFLSVALLMPLLLSGCAGAGDAAQPKEASVSVESAKETGGDNTAASASITEAQALDAIRNYCHINNPDLEAIEKAGEYPVGWEIASADKESIVVLFRSYTGAEVRYYIDPVSGDTYVTEFVSGITPEEERTDESFNVRDYLQ